MRVGDRRSNDLLEGHSRYCKQTPRQMVADSLFDLFTDRGSQVYLVQSLSQTAQDLTNKILGYSACAGFPQ